jgi:excisionase family DNA binding protein
MGRTIMSKSEAAEFLDIPISALEKLVKEEKIPFTRISKTGKKILFKKGELLKWVRSKKIKL